MIYYTGFNTGFIHPTISHLWRDVFFVNERKLELSKRKLLKYQKPLLLLVFEGTLVVTMRLILAIILVLIVIFLSASTLSIPGFRLEGLSQLMYSEESGFSLLHKASSSYSSKHCANFEQFNFC